MNKMNKYRTTARIVGIVYLGGFIVSLSGNGLVQSILGYNLYRAKLVPRLLALWGLVGYVLIFCGMLSEIMGSGLGLISSIPGGLWEIFIGVWLIVKGFNSSAIIFESAKTDN